MLHIRGINAGRRLVKPAQEEDADNDPLDTIAADKTTGSTVHRQQHSLDMLAESPIHTLVVNATLQSRLTA